MVSQVPFPDYSDVRRLSSFSQNVGLVNMTKVVNRFTIMTGAVFMILAGLFPPIGNFFASLPQSVLGGCTIMMFGTIMISGIQMLAKAGFSQRNVTIAALSLAVGIGFTSTSEVEIWNIFPQICQRRIFCKLRGCRICCSNDPQPDFAKKYGD